MQKLIFQALILLSTINLLNGHRFGLFNFSRPQVRFQTASGVNPISASGGFGGLNPFFLRSNVGSFNNPFFNPFSGAQANPFLALIDFSTNPPTLRVSASDLGLTGILGTTVLPSGAVVNVTSNGGVQLLALANGESPFTLLNASATTQQPVVQASSDLTGTSLSTGK